MRGAVAARSSVPAAESVAADERTPQEHGSALQQAISYFRERDPKGWDELALCPLRHGVETILERLWVMR